MNNPRDIRIGSDKLIHFFCITEIKLMEFWFYSDDFFNLFKDFNV
ncbi:Uncharacterised protein [Mycobacterium tuberculosis]|nr:Uncharacterised protein [Mycobacterium tuberculosis]